MDQTSTSHPGAPGSAQKPERPGDADLISKVRAGDTRAFDTLYIRHSAAARYLAGTQLDNSSDTDDVVSDAFASVFKSLVEGKGPDAFFRSYLLMAVRRIAHDRNRKAFRTVPTEDGVLLDSSHTDEDRLLREFESMTMARAFSALPERWQAVLWHVDIEGLKPAAAAVFIGLSPNGVSSLLIRAREGLRRAYLQEHVAATPNDPCAAYVDQLGSFARKGLKRTTRERLEDHLAGCVRCTALLSEILDVQPGLRAWVFPLVTGLAFTPGFAAAEPTADSPSMSARPRKPGIIVGALALVLLSGSLAIGLAQSHPVESVSAALPQATATASQEVASAPSEPAPKPQTPDVSPQPDPVPPVIRHARPTSAPEPAVAPPAAVPALPPPLVVGSGPVSFNLIPAPTDPSSAKRQAVTATLSVTPVTGTPHIQLRFSFVLDGDTGPSDGDVQFMVPGTSEFQQQPPATPPGWACAEVQAQLIRCATSELQPGTLIFGVTVSPGPQRTDRQTGFEFAGENVLRKTFAAAF